MKTLGIHKHIFVLLIHIFFSYLFIFRQFRFVAYRQFSHWAYSRQRLRRSNRVVIPTYVVQKIRQQFPANEGEEYVGFRKAFDTSELWAD